MNQVEARLENIETATGEGFCGWQSSYGYIAYCWLWRVRLHLFYAPEPSVMFHDHGWSFHTFPLRSYVERVLDPATGEVSTEIVRAFRFSRRPAEHTHKYLGRWSGSYDEKGVPTVRAGIVPTICIRGKGGREWFYWRATAEGARRYPWRDYLKRVENRALRLVKTKEAENA